MTNKFKMTQTLQGGNADWRTIFQKGRYLNSGKILDSIYAKSYPEQVAGNSTQMNADERT